MPKLIILLLLLLIQGNTFESSSSVKIEPTYKWTVIGKETMIVQGKPIELTVWVKKKNQLFLLFNRDIFNNRNL
jgi:hypothetical protein